MPQNQDDYLDKSSNFLTDKQMVSFGEITDIENTLRIGSGTTGINGVDIMVGSVDAAELSTASTVKVSSTSTLDSDVPSYGTITQVTGAVKATGSIQFEGNLAVDDTLTINGVEFTIVASGASGNQINRGTDLSTTLDNAVTVLNASAEADVSVATYSSDTVDTLIVTYDTYGTTGNSFTLAATTSGKALITQVAGAVKATGSITFADNPTAADTITMNGTAFEFVASGATGNQINIGATLPDTLDNAIAVLNASEVAGVAVATYTEDDTSVLTITYDTYGTTGNSYTLAASADTVSGSTLSGGVQGVGSIEFGKNPEVDDIITVNGVAFTFVASGATGAQINIGATLPDTLDNIVTVLNASVEANVALATYSNDSADKLIVTYDESALDGSAFTLAASLTDTDVAVTDMAGGTNAVGSIAFVSNLFVGDTLTINGVEFTIVASGASGNEINVNTTLSGTLDNAVTVLNASAEADVALATYSKTGSNDTLTATYDDSALDGSAFTLAASSTGGSGAKTVTVYGLDTNWDLLEETVTLDGQNAVETVGEFIYPYKAEVVSGAGANIGIIYVGNGAVTTGTPATKYLSIPVGAGESSQAFLPVPADYKFDIDNISVIVGAAATVNLCYKDTTITNGVWYEKPLVIPAAGKYDFDIDIQAFEEKHLVKLTSSVAGGTGTSITGWINGTLKK